MSDWGATWRRDVYVADDDQTLMVDSNRPNANPPGRQDSSTDITTYPQDRPARIVYRPRRDGRRSAPRLTGIVMDDGGAVPTWLEVTLVRGQLQIVDGGGEGTTASYRLVGDWKDAPQNPIYSEDPQIHNSAE